MQKYKWTRRLLTPFAQAHDLRGSLLLTPHTLKNSTAPSKDSPTSSPQIAQGEERSRLQTLSQWSRSVPPGNMQLSYKVQRNREKASIFSELGGRSQESISDGLMGPIQHSVQPDYYPRSLDLKTLVIEGV